MKKRTYLGVKHKHILSILLVVVLSCTMTGYAYEGNPLLEEVKQILRNNYVSSLPEQVFQKQSISELIKEINQTDPYTKYYSSAGYSEFINNINYNSTLIGAYVKMTTEGAVVESIIKNSAESLAGLQVGDIIVLADSHILINEKLELAVKYILGEEGKTVILRVKRGDSFLSINVKRVAEKNSTVEGQVLDKHIGYIKISSFGMDSAYLFESKLNQLKRLGVDCYIVDLRYNNGGLANIAVDIAGYFIGSLPALITKNRISGEQTWKGTFQGQLVNRPVMFLINGYSVSASEILAAAMKDYKRGKLVGARTYGKGSIQSGTRLSNRDVLKLTIEKFYSPKRNQIDQIGVVPDIDLGESIDSLRVAQLLFSTNEYKLDARGKVKIVFGSNVIITDVKRMTTTLFWKTYRQLLDLAYSSGKVYLGSIDGWTQVAKKEIRDYATMCYPTYTKKVRVENLGVDQALKIDLAKEGDLVKENVGNNNIELIDAQSGARVATKFEVKGNKILIVSPIGNLKQSRTYYLIVHPSLIKQNSTMVQEGKLPTGMINEIVTEPKYSAQNDKGINH